MGTSTCGGDGTTQGASACTVSGEIIFSQNGLKDVLCGNNAGLSLNLQGSGMRPATSTSSTSTPLPPAFCHLQPAPGRRLLRSPPPLSEPTMGSTSTCVLTGTMSTAPTARLLWMGWLWELWTPPPPPKLLAVALQFLPRKTSFLSLDAKM